jgi:hypothetical protein
MGPICSFVLVFIASRITLMFFMSPRIILKIETLKS